MLEVIFFFYLLSILKKKKNQLTFCLQNFIFIKIQAVVLLAGIAVPNYSPIYVSITVTNYTPIWDRSSELRSQPVELQSDKYGIKKNGLFFSKMIKIKISDKIDKEVNSSTF